MSNRFQKAQKIILELKKRYKKVTIGTLRQAIIMGAGGDEQRVVLPYLRMMSELGMIKETKTGWELNAKKTSNPKTSPKL